MIQSFARRRWFVSILSLCGVATALAAGPDVIVGDLPDIRRYPAPGDIGSFSVATTSCNNGTEELKWIADTPAHPVIAQHFYRLKEGRFQQLGVSWVKHGFLALNQTLCGACSPNPGPGARLGVGCSDPYSTGNNGDQSTLGPRSEINPFTGVFPYEPGQPNRPPIPPGEGPIARRIRVRDADLAADQNPGAEYFAEGQYVTADDAAAGNGNNNVSYRRAFPTVVGGKPSLRFSPTDSTRRTEPAINAWKVFDPQVKLFTVDVPSEGRLVLGLRSIPMFAGGFHNEIALYNQTSHRAAGGLTLSFPQAASITAAGFSDVHHHSGSTQVGDDWTSSIAEKSIAWVVPTNPNPENANALRWGTLYNFWFDSNIPPTSAEIGLFRPGEPAAVAVNLAPAEPEGVSAPKAWLSADSSCEVGTLKKGQVVTVPGYKALAIGGADKKIKAIKCSDPNLKVSYKSVAEKNAKGWEISVEASADANPGYHEAALTIESELASDAPLVVRISCTVE